MTVFRFLGAILVGLLIAVLLLAAVEAFSAVVHPFPADFGNTMDDMHEHVARYPAWVLAVVVPVWGLIALLSTWIAKRIGGRIAGFVMGFLLMLGVLFNVSSLPYPIWFKIASVAVILVAVLLPIRRPGFPPGNHLPR